MDLNGSLFEGKLLDDGRIKWANDSLWEREQGFDGEWCKVRTGTAGSRTANSRNTSIGWETK